MAEENSPAQVPLELELASMREKLLDVEHRLLRLRDHAIANEAETGRLRALNRSLVQAKRDMEQAHDAQLRERDEEVSRVHNSLGEALALVYAVEGTRTWRWRARFLRGRALVLRRGDGKP
jgi:hypothetical protein